MIVLAIISPLPICDLPHATVAWTPREGFRRQRRHLAVVVLEIRLGQLAHRVAVRNGIDLHPLTFATGPSLVGVVARRDAVEAAVVWFSHGTAANDETLAEVPALSGAA